MNFEITSGINDKPLKVVVYGPEGIGKSTFAAQSQNLYLLTPKDPQTL